MKNKDIELMLKEKASKQEVNDIQKSILNSVDTSKVLADPKKAPVPKRRLLPLLISGFAVAILLITLSISIGVNSNNTPADKPDTPVAPQPTLDPVNTINSVLDDDMKLLYERITTQEAYDIVNVAHTFDTVSFAKVEASDNKYLTPALEESIVNDLNTYIYNIEDMLKLVDPTRAIASKNTNANYNYETVTAVEGTYNSYSIYFNEKLEEEKNIDSENYRLKATLNGIIACNDKDYVFVGVKRIKNSKLQYETTISIGESKYVEIKESFSRDSNEFNYTYHYGNNVKMVRISQKLDENKNTKEISFVANESETNEVKLTIEPIEGKYIFCNIKAREKEELDVTKNNGVFTYKFKNSGNEYTR